MDDRTLLYAVLALSVLVLISDLYVLRSIETGQAPPRAPPSNVADVRCALCEYLVSMVYDYLEEQKHEQEIEALLEKACDILPPDLRDDCHGIIDSDLPDIIDLAVEKVPPGSICSTVLPMDCRG